MSFIRSIALALLAFMLGWSVARAEDITKDNVLEVLTRKADDLDFSVKFRLSTCTRKKLEVCEVVMDSSKKSNEDRFVVAFQPDNIKALADFTLVFENKPKGFLASQVSLAASINSISDYKVDFLDVVHRYSDQLEQLRSTGSADPIEFVGVRQDMRDLEGMTVVRISRIGSTIEK